MIFLPLLAAFMEAADDVLDKYLLSYRHVGHRQFIILLFLFLATFSWLLVPFFGRVDLSHALEGRSLGLLAALLALAIPHNIFLYQGIEKERIQNYELIVMFTPFAVMLASAIFLPEERDPRVLLPGIIGASGFVFGHLRQHHLILDIFQIRLIGYLITFALEAVVTRLLLDIYNPVVLYAIRTSLLLPLFYLGFRAPSFSRLHALDFLGIFVSAIASLFFMLSLYTAYLRLGIVFTEIGLLLSPILVFFFAREFLHERFTRRKLAAFLIILGSIGATYLVKID